MTETFEEKYPEHVKMKPLTERSQIIGEFLDWLQHERDTALCELRDLGSDEWWPEKQYIPISKGIEALLAEYYDVDMKVIEQEKREMIKELREANADESQTP